MKLEPASKILALTLVGLATVALPALAEDLRGTVKSVDAANSRIIVHDAKNDRDVVVNFTKSTTLSRSNAAVPNIRDLKIGSEVSVSDAVTAASISVIEPVEAPSPEAGEKSILQEFWYNFRHNLFKPLLLFFYLGFMVPILRVHFEFPYVMYQALTIYLLIAIGWHGGEADASRIRFEAMSKDERAAVLAFLSSL